MVNRDRYTQFFILVLLLTLISNAEAASSSMNNAGFLDSILQRFADASKMWQSILVKIGTSLFISLSTISLVWTFGMMAISNDNFKSIFGEMVRFIMTFGLFYWFLLNAGEFSSLIIQSCRTIAARLLNSDGAMTPSALVDVGFDIFNKALSQSSMWSPLISWYGLVIATFILIILAWISAELLVLLIAGWILGYGGIFLLGFGGVKWTQDIAINYFRQVLSLGLHAFSIVLIAGIGWTFIDQYYAAMNEGIRIFELTVMLIAVLSLGIIIKKVPPMMSAIVGGAGGGGGGLSFSPMSAAAMGMAAGGTLGAAATSVMANAAGGASALKEAFKGAQNNMASAPSSSGLSGLLSTANQFAKDMGNQLSQGIKQTAMDKLDTLKASAQERIAETLGGQVASNIQTMNQAISNYGENRVSGDSDSSTSINQKVGG